MAEQELDLFDVPSVLAAELGAGTALVPRPESLDPDLFGALLDDRLSFITINVVFLSR